MDPAVADDRPTFVAPNRAVWRAWLADNHATQARVWLVYSKKGSGTASVSYAEAVEEALCYGWIDSVVNPVDDQRYMQLFTPRKRGSTWSKVNKERIERLSAAGLIMPPGRDKIAAAKADGSWTILDEVEALHVPGDLAEALAANRAARRFFDSLRPGVKKKALWHIASAKRADTRARRIREVVDAAARGHRVP